MPDFQGLDPIITPESPKGNKSAYNPAADIIQPNPTLDGGGGVPQTNGMDLIDYYSSTSDYSKPDVVYSQKELLDNKRYGVYNPTIKNQEDYHAQGQSGLDRVANAGWNFVNKTGAYFLQSAGFILGAIPAAVGGIANLTNQALGGKGDVVNNGNAISLMTDNFLTNLGDVWKENVQETNPIYKSDKYTNGNIWSKLHTTDWWLDDAVDRLALTASMVAPGALEAKGFGLFGAALDEASGGLKATGLGSKAIQALADNPELYGKLGKMLGNQIYKTAATGTVDLEAAAALRFKGLIQAAQKAELYSWNIIGQSGLNGKEAQVSIRKALHEQKDQGLINISDEEIEQKAAEGAMKGFAYTLPLSIGASFYELPQIFSTAKSAESALKKFFNAETLEALETSAVSAKPTISKILGKTLLTGLEHGQNESMQVAVGRYLEDSIAGKIKDDKLEKDQGGFGSIMKDWLDNVNDPNGQNNIALGTIQGMLMTLGGHAAKSSNKLSKALKQESYSQQDEAAQKFREGITQAVARRRYFYTPDDIFEKDENGKIATTVDDKGKAQPKFNQERLAAMGISMMDSQTEILAKVQAIKDGNKLSLDQLNFNSLAALGQNFFDDPNGMEYLTNLLKFEAKNQKEDINRVNDTEAGIQVTPEVQLQRNIAHVLELKKAHDAIDQRHAGFTSLNVDRTNPDEVKLAANYINGTKNFQYFNAADQIFFSSQLQKNAAQLANLGILERVEKPSSPQELQANKLIDQNEALEHALELTKEVYKQSIDRTTFRDTFDLMKEQAKSNKKILEDLKNSPSTEDAPISVKQVDLNDTTKTIDKELKVGETYPLTDLVHRDENTLTLAPKITIISGPVDGKLQVTNPNGTSEYLDSEQFIGYNIGTAEADAEELKKTMDKSIDETLKDEKFSSIEKPTEGVDKLEYVNSLNNPELISAVETKFNEDSKTEIEERVEKQKIMQNDNLSKELLSTVDEDSVPTADFDRPYEIDSRKTDQQVTDSTSPPVEGYSEAASAPHHVRANQFGANYYDLPGSENFRGVVVTSGNEAIVGLPGLTQWLKDKGTGDASIVPTKTIVMVVMGIDPTTGEKYFVGVDGKKLAKPTLENTIYQTFPIKLSWAGGDSMFRDADSREDEIVALEKEYNKWREQILNNPTSDLYQISASFGSPSYVGELSASGKFERDYSARTPVIEAGLVNDTQLRTKRVVGVATSDDAQTRGSVTMNNIKGLPTLFTTNGMVKLDNRQFTTKEAKLMFDVIKKLSTNLFTDGNLKSGESQMLYNWLKSVVYWGTPTDTQGNRKAAGYSSVFFENMKLKIGKDETQFYLDPKELEKNKEAIIDRLSKLYHNVNSSLTKGSKVRPWNAKYTEILEIDGNDIKTREWQNYQSYLLSAKDPEGKIRSSVDIPLTTQMKPLKNATDTNRKGIYFTLMDKKSSSSAEPIVAKSTKVTTAPKESKLFDLTGEKNTTVLDKLGNVEITFSIDPEKFDVNSDTPRGILIPDEDSDSEFKIKLEKLTGILENIPGTGITADMSDEDAFKITKSFIRQIITAKIRNQQAPAPEAPAQKQTEKAPAVSDIEAKKADIEKRRDVEKRRQEELDKEFGRNLEVVKSEKKAVISRIPDLVKLSSDPQLSDTRAQEVIDKYKAINAKYDAQLAALESSKPTEAPKVNPNLQKKINQRKQQGDSKRGSDYRLQVANNFKNFQTEDWKKVEQWISKNLPNLPLYRVRNIIQATGGKLAFGMLKDGAIYLYQNAEVGTVYHEVFEAVWKMFTSQEERDAILKEFRNRKGSYTDPFTSKEIKYSEATDQDIKEKLAEEFRDHTLKQEATESKSLLSRIFSQILDFIKTFFLGKHAQENTDRLFENIGTGYYAQYSPSLAGLSFAQKGIIDIDSAIGDENSEFKLAGFTGEQVNDIMQHMTYTIVKDLFESNEGLFNLVGATANKAQVYETLKDELGDLIAENVVQLEKMTDQDATPEERTAAIEANNILYNNILDNWDDLQAKHQEYIKSYGIEFDENDDLIPTMDRSKDDPYGDASKIDHMKKANAAIKLLLASLPVTNADGSNKLSSIGGYTLVPMSEAFISVMNNTHNSRSIDEMVSRIKKMADQDPKYTKLYNRLSKMKNIGDLDNKADLQLLASLWRTFKKQAPTVKNVYLLENGDVQVGDANFSTAARQTQQDFIENIKGSIEDGSKYFTYNAYKNVYYGNSKAITDEKLNSLQAQVDFLKELGIEFDYTKLSRMPEKTLFSKAVNGIRQSIANAKQVISFSGKSLSIDTRLRQLAEIKAKMDNPEFSSTFYNVNGELTQTFIGTNAASDLYDHLSQIDNLSELKGTQYEYLLTDTFAKNSNLLYTMFDKQSGGRIELDEDAEFSAKQYMHPAYAGGVVDNETGKQKEASKLNYKDRLLQEINLNREGYYLNLIPGDAALEWMLFMGNRITKDDISIDYKAIHAIFKGYFIDEFNLSKDNRPIALLKLTDEDKAAGKKQRESTDLRFFKSILGEELHNEVISKEGTAEQVYDSFTDPDTKINQIDEKVTEFINREKESLKKALTEYNLLKQFDNGFKTEGLSFGKEVIKEDELDRELATLSANYIMNNIELHKLLYSDPYQYSDELKRIKSFSSPRQSIIADSVEMNEALNNVWNKRFAVGTIGHTDFNIDSFKTITLGDVTAGSLLTNTTWTETDGGGIISLPAARNFKIRSGDWDSEQERQYEYDIAWEKQDKGQKLTKAEKRTLREGNPQIKRTYTPIKPIVSGNKANGKTYNDIVLDKFALTILSYRAAKEIKADSNAVKLYNMMQDQQIDYAVYESGRKVGAEQVHQLYDLKTGDFNEAPFSGIINVPFSIMSVQSEVPSKDDNLVTRGSQMTKLATLDFMAAGVPIDYKGSYEDWYSLKTEEEREKASPLYKEIKNNQNILERMIESGVNSLLKTFDIIKVDGGYKLGKIDKIADTLKKELTKREVNDNILAALQGFKNGDVVIEATPAYQQIRNVLYSIANREVISPKINGGMKVQVPSTLLESSKVAAVKINGKNAYTSDTLKFYEDKDGQRVCEIMVGRWFKSDLSDEQLIKELKDSGVLDGVAFRIPTQKQNSIDVFRIARFLPEEFGDSVVIPSQLVEKVGSDFDIDKLSIYLKNVDDSERGVPRMLSTKGEGKGNLENAYIESLQNLIGHPLNFERLTTANSADQLKGLAKKIVDKMGLGSFDYGSTGNMLSRRFMSRLRHAFVSGKYAIGIAAVNQTNHSLNQRSPIVLDFEARKDLLSAADRKFLKDGKIKFEKYNQIDGKPTISMITNADDEYISDILGQFIDGYVDISKGPWIMELGATPNVASTWMFLTKVGVPINTTAYFMNQPIIREYLRELERSGYSWLFNTGVLNKIQKKYKADGYFTSKMPSEEKLFENIGKTTFDKVGKSEQRFILNEFLKYAKMAEHMFKLTQGTNFDTASFNDPFLVSRKMEQLDKARNTIFSSADSLLKNSFLGKLMNSITDIRNALATVLKADQGRTRQVLQDVLTPYVEMNDRDFVRTSQRAVSTLFDWAVQTNEGLNKKIKSQLIGKDNTAKKMWNFVKKVKKDSTHPLYNNQVINILKPHFGAPGEVNNLQIRNKNNKVYDQNQLTYAFTELKNYLESEGKGDLYDKLVKLSVLQSGLTESNISFTNLLPYEDVKKMYNDTLSDLDQLSTLEDFKNLNIFERNFWNYSDVVPYMAAKSKYDPVYNERTYNENMSFPEKIYNGIKSGDIPQLLRISPFSKEAENDILVYTWEKNISSKEKAKMRKEADFSYKQKGLFKKVGSYDRGDGQMNYIYKAINAWGDGKFANEFYLTPQKSVIDNGFITADESISDEHIMSYFQGLGDDIESLLEDEQFSEDLQDPNQTLQDINDFLARDTEEKKDLDCNSAPF
jgi:hypothetical protein